MNVFWRGVANCHADFLTTFLPKTAAKGAANSEERKWRLVMGVGIPSDGLIALVLVLHGDPFNGVAELGVEVATANLEASSMASAVFGALGAEDQDAFKMLGKLGGSGIHSTLEGLFFFGSHVKMTPFPSHDLQGSDTLVPLLNQDWPGNVE